MVALLVTVHILVSLFLIFVILLQPGKGDSMAALGGGGGGNSASVFGSRGSVTFLAKVTEVCAIIFMLTSLALAYRSSHSDSVLRARRNIAAQDATKKDADKTAPAGGGTSLPTGAGQATPAAPGVQNGTKAPADAASKSAPPAAAPAQTPPAGPTPTKSK